MLVYFNLVSDARRRFARELPRTLRLLTKTDPDLVPGVDPKLFFAHGEHAPARRADIFAAFAADDTASLADSPLVAEGPHRERPGRPLLKAEEDDNAEHRKVCAGWNMSSVG